jgi:hypothetical protein
MAIRRMLMSNGKLNTAIRILLLFAFEEIPEIRQSEEAKPIDVRHSVRKNVR